MNDYLTLWDKDGKIAKSNYFLYKLLNDFPCFKTTVCGVYTQMYVPKYMYMCLHIFTQIYISMIDMGSFYRFTFIYVKLSFSPNIS